MKGRDPRNGDLRGGACRPQDCEDNHVLVEAAESMALHYPAQAD